MMAPAERREAPAVVDAQNPWPGLAPFEESAERFFHGRGHEIAELSRLILSSHLTVLFGASGLGKTSLLQAGLFPRLRRSHVFPVYIRLRVEERDGPLIGQIQPQLESELRVWGVEHPPFREGESLWEYLHREDLELWSRQNQLLTPLFVFDQFEEVLTLGAENPAAIEQLRIDLADLVENRIPAALSRRSHDGLQLGSRRYRLLLSFREDYLPGFEIWKRELPSMMHNRYRLTHMNGANALEAVVQPGGELIEEPVAKAVVRFVAAANDAGEQEDGTLESLQVEPALLSVVCHELNRRRASDGRATITAADLEAARGNILNDFYERSFEGLEEARLFVEERLLTRTGFRNTAPEDDAERAGISRAAIKQLVDRRLIRREQRLGVWHLELTHDLLTGVARASRDARRERAARAEGEERRQAEERRRRAKVMRTAGAIVGVLILGLAVLAMWSGAQARKSAAFALRTSIEAERQQHRAELNAVEADRQRALALEQQRKLEIAQAAEEAAKRRAQDEVGVTKAALASTRIRAGANYGSWQVVIGPSGRTLVTIGLDGTAHISGDVMAQTISDPAGPIRTGAINARDTLLATASVTGEVKIWSLADGRLSAAFPMGRPISSMAFAGSNLVLAGTDGIVERIDTRTGKVIRTENAAAGKGRCVPFRAVILEYSPLPGFIAQLELEAKCLAGDAMASITDTPSRGLTPAQAAFAAGPIAEAAKGDAVSSVLPARTPDGAPSPPPPKQQVEQPKPAAAPPLPPAPVRPAAPAAEEDWSIGFRLRDPNGAPYLQVDVQVSSGNTSSRSLVLSGLSEAQLRAVAAAIQKLMHNLEDAAPELKVGKPVVQNGAQVDPKLIAAATRYAMPTAKEILKALNLSPR